MKENNNKNDYRKYEDRNYDDANKYDFYPKFYLHYAIGTKFENIVEITKKEYVKLKKLLGNKKDSMIEVFAIYAVGFYKTPETYVIQAVDKDVYYCLFNSQRYEKNKRRNERQRYLDIYFSQDNLSNIASDESIELEVIKKIEENEIKVLLSSILSEKQYDRFYKNKIEEIPLVVIAIQEKSTPDSVRDSVNKAKRKIRKNYKNKKFKKF